MHRLSSNATLFFKLFLPVFWTSVVLMMTLAAWFMPIHYFGGVPLQSLRYGLLFTLIAGSASLLLLFWPLKRVESDGEYIYVNSYFRSARYSFAKDIQGFYQTPYIFYRQSVIELNGVGTFGRKIRFMASRKLLARFREEYPELLRPAE